MSILKRFSDIMASNVNSILSKFEDPAKMVDQLLRNLQSDLNKVKGETAGIMADEARAKRSLDECNAEIKKMHDYAQRAVLAGNDDDARKFLTMKSKQSEKLAQLQKSYDLAASNSQKMRQMHDKLVSQINELNSRRDTIKAKMAVAKAQERINKVGASASSATSNLDTFSRMEEKADRLLDKANAMAELNASSDDGMDDLMSKYETCNSSVEDELNALKGINNNDVEDELAELKKQAIETDTEE
ncbi:UNVERIFIED_CONTAM: phage shock protein A (PspA) family protein [Acetivibrio alkalicellulosi]